MHSVLRGSGVPLGKDSCKIRTGLRDTVQHCSARHILEGRFEVKSNKDPRVATSARCWMVLIIVFAPFGLPTPCCKGPAHLTTESFFAAITDLSASLRRKDMSGLWPPVGLASGVICPAFRYCSTGLGTAAAAMCAITYKSLFPAREPKSHQCSARMPSGLGSLSRGVFRRAAGTCSATSDKNRADTGAGTGAGGSGSAG